MKPDTADDVFDLLDSYLTSAALGAAMELGLFWLLAEQPLDVAGVGGELGIPTNRCRYWLQLLESVGLVEQVPNGYAPSETARTAILDAYSQETWAFVAQEARQRFPLVRDLALHIRELGSVWTAQGLTAPNYYAQIVESPERARRFTRMLYEIHLPLAEELAQCLDLSGVKRLMDLGGGSGVMSLALLRRQAQLEAVVVDIPNVCAAGREIAEEYSMTKRFTYHEADFLQDELPTGFDLVLECDVGPYSEALFRKVRAALNPGGRLVVIDHFVSDSDVAPPSCLFWAFEGSLANPDLAYTTTDEIRARLARAGFQVLSERALPSGKVWRWSADWVMIEARG
jgi:predicted TPR repeat methyltransferase